MNERNFIDHSNSRDFNEREIENASLETQYSKLTEEERTWVALKALGYSRKPPEIEEFYSDDFYLGNEYFFNGGSSVFNYWKKVLNEIYPSCILTAKPYQILSGAIGLT